MTRSDKDRLWQAAVDARKNAYAPYSGFTVGAALLAADGRIFTGCNVENAAYSPTLCAERVALGAAIAAGVRDFAAIAVIGGRGEILADTPPCGVCRQVMAEFCDTDFEILLSDGKQIRGLTLGELLPFGFTKEHL